MPVDQTLLQRASELSWYHTLELAPGHTTRGMFDLRPSIGEYAIPERLDGMRVLEIGTWDGFWAFELERRGATVVSTTRCPRISGRSTSSSAGRSCSTSVIS